ncbi:unnamed protein product [Camellia sinensis]
MLEVLNKPYKMNGSDHKNNPIMHHKMKHNSHCCVFATTVTPIPGSNEEMNFVPGVSGKMSMIGATQPGLPVGDIPVLKLVL